MRATRPVCLLGCMLSACATGNILPGGENCVTDDDCPAQAFCVNQLCVSLCNSDGECDNGLFCDGPEGCEDGVCTRAAAPCEGLDCDEENDWCTGCTKDDQCDNGDYCDGAETCDQDAICRPAANPCAASSSTPVCDEVNDQCVECLDASQCDNGTFCDGVESCSGGVCQTSPGNPCPPAADLTRIRCDEEGDRCVACLNDLDCNNGVFCDGFETCGSDKVCHAGSDPCTAPGYSVCDETNDACVGCLRDDDCSNDAFCDGEEECISSECSSPGDPCSLLDNNCDEVNDKCVACVSPEDCSNGIFCDGPETCNDGVCGAGPGDPCASNSQLCDEDGDQCVECLDDSDCSNGVYCDGVEPCMSGSCGASPGTPCTSGLTCDEDRNTCLGCSLSEQCDDGNFCNGDETCDDNECIAGTAPCPPAGEPDRALCDEANDTCVECFSNSNCDDGSFCNGAETCNQTSHVCEAATNPCPPANDPSKIHCDEDANICRQCINDDDCQDDAFCNGDEVCNNFSCQPGTGAPCPPTGEPTLLVCDETADVCVECLAAADCDNLDPCDGVESCDSGTDECVPGMPPDCVTERDANHPLCEAINSVDYQCICLADPNSCDDSNRCNGVEFCNTSLSADSCQTIPSLPAIDCLSEPGHDGNAYHPICQPMGNDDFTCVCGADTCDDGVACNGTEDCQSGACAPGTTTCSGTTPVCDEVGDRCVCHDDGGGNDSCDDGDGCNGVEDCNTGTGVCSSPADYDCSGTPTTPVCHDNSGTPECWCEDDGTDSCDDGVACNGVENCNESTGVCAPGAGQCCGDGVVETFEACDDGNTEGGDGCSADCSTVEAGYMCFDGLPCRLACRYNGECPGRIVTMLLALDDLTNSVIRESLIAATVDWVTPTPDPTVLYVRDDHTQGESPDDLTTVFNFLDSLSSVGVSTTAIDEPSSGLSATEVSGFDVVWFANPGYPIDDAQTLATLRDFVFDGNGVVLQGDDMAWTAPNGQPSWGTVYCGDTPHPYHGDLSGLSCIHNGHLYCDKNTDNGRDAYLLTIANVDHPLVAGIEGLNANYVNDIDITAVLSLPYATVEILATATVLGADFSTPSASCPPIQDRDIPVIVAQDLGTLWSP